MKFCAVSLLNILEAGSIMKEVKPKSKQDNFCYIFLKKKHENSDRLAQYLRYLNIKG